MPARRRVEKERFRRREEKKMKKNKVIAFITVALMIVTMVPTLAYAIEGTNSTDVEDNEKIFL